MSGAVFFGTGKFYEPTHTHTFFFTHKKCIVVMRLARAPQPKPFVAVKGGEKQQELQEVQEQEVQELQEQQVHPHVAW